MKCLVFLGTVRNSTPPRPARLGSHVAAAIMTCLQQQQPDHECILIDAIDYPLDPVFKPHFAYAQNRAPTKLDALANQIASADAYVMISPEYNHSMSPALANLLNHFGSSLFAYKPSAIVTYSAGQWGGIRAAVSMRTFLSELGCLPVSAMIHVPNAAAVFNADGTVQSGEDQARWFGYFNRTFAQLMWWATATKSHREIIDPHNSIRDFNTAPSQRNAP